MKQFLRKGVADRHSAAVALSVEFKRQNQQPRHALHCRGCNEYRAWRSTTGKPRRKFVRVCVNALSGMAGKAMDGEATLTFPHLYCTSLAPQKAGDRFPAPEALKTEYRFAQALASFVQ